MQSIINACHSTKQARHWFDNASTKEVLNEFGYQNATGRILPLEHVIEYRDGLANGLRGYYIHHLLVNAVAMWASPRYAIHVFELLHEIATQERAELQQRIDEQQQRINEQQHVINTQRPRLVPEHKERRYTYLIWYEDHPFDNAECQLHLVRRNNDSFKQLDKHHKDKVWFIKHDLPIAMTPNEDIKTLIHNAIDCHIKANVITIRKASLKQAYDIVVKYFDEYTS